VERIRLRRAGVGDARAVFRWRNAPETRRFSFTTRPIAWSEHLRWFGETLRRPDRRLLIGERGGRAIGVLRYDTAGGSAEVSVYLVPGLGGRGLGPALLRAGSAWVRRYLPGVTWIRASIRRDNPGSQRAFEKAGFRESCRIYEYPIKRSRGAGARSGHAAPGRGRCQA
jgi:RimJ/RimL family protein N-acetyltransferase